jgi:hypothetical protein
VEEVGQHPDAALLELGRHGVLGVIDEVAVEVVGDQPLRLGLHPRRHEGGEISLRIAVQEQLPGDQPHRVLGRHPGFGKVIGGGVLGYEAIAEAPCHGLIYVRQRSLISDNAIQPRCGFRCIMQKG